MRHLLSSFRRKPESTVHSSWILAFAGMTGSRGVAMLGVFIIVGALFVLDQLSKWYILEQLFQQAAASVPFTNWLTALRITPLPEQDPIVLHPMLNITLAWNKGVSFSLLHSEAGFMPYAFAVFSVLVSIAFLVFASRVSGPTRTNRNMQRIACAMIVGGALGNAYDRIRFGAVVDFIQVHWQDHYFPAFNLADSCISVGVGLLLLYGHLLTRKG